MTLNTLDVSAMTDEQLKAERNKLPKYTNYMTEEQIKYSYLLYDEQMRRFKQATEEYNKLAITETGLNFGDKVECYIRSWIGFGAERYTGKVVKDRGGRMAVRMDKADGAGKKTAPINIGWKKVQP